MRKIFETKMLIYQSRLTKMSKFCLVIPLNGSLDNKEIGGQNLSRFTMSSMTKATLSIYSHRGFVLVLPKLVKNAT